MSMYCTITTPQKKVIAAKNGRGPIFLHSTVAGGWQMIYVMKKTKAMMFCSRQYQAVQIQVNPYISKVD